MALGCGGYGNIGRDIKVYKIIFGVIKGDRNYTKVKYNSKDSEKIYQ